MTDVKFLAGAQLFLHISGVTMGVYKVSCPVNTGNKVVTESDWVVTAACKDSQHMHNASCIS